MTEFPKISQADYQLVVQKKCEAIIDGNTLTDRDVFPSVNGMIKCISRDLI